MKKAWMILLALLATVCLQAQEVYSELEKINSYYQENPDQHIRFQCDMFESHEASTPAHTYKGEVWTKGIKKYQKLGDSEMVTGKGFVINIDHSQKMMMISQILEQNAVKQDLGEAMETVKHMLSICDSQEIKTVSGAVRQLVLTLPEASGSEKMVVNYSSASYRIQKITLYGRTPLVAGESGKSKMVMSYRFVDKEKVASVFELNKYVKKVNGQHVAVGEYTGYKVYDQLNQ